MCNGRAKFVITLIINPPARWVLGSSKIRFRGLKADSRSTPRLKERKTQWVGGGGVQGV